MRDDSALRALGRITALCGVMVVLASRVIAQVPAPAETPVVPAPAPTEPPSVAAQAPAPPVSASPPSTSSNRLYAIPQTSTATPAISTGDGYQLSFIDTDIATVVGTVLGDGLGMPYTIDPQVKGTMTLQAARPLSREEALAALEAALRVQGAALVDVNGVLNVIPSKDAPKRITTLRLADQRGAGFGIYIIPLQFIAATDMEKILQPFAPDGGVLRVDAARNLLLLAGTAQEISNLISVVNTFDVDWLAGMSFGLYPLTNVEPKALVAELSEVFSDSKSPIAGVVRLVPLSRLNSIMVVTPQEKYQKEVESWIKRFDIASATPGRRIYVYDVQNSKADDLAKALNSILSLSGYSGSSGTVPGNGGSYSQPFSSTGGGASGGFGGGSSGSAGASIFNSPRPSAPQVSFPSPTGGGGDSEFGDVKIVPSEENNSLIIMASASEYSVIESTLKRLDVVPIQVLIEASIAEVTLTDDLQFGLQWSYQGANGPLVLSESSSGNISQKFPGLSYLYTGRPDIRAVLNTLASHTKVKVLSSPKLLVINNREAQLQIGDQVPIATQSRVSSDTSDAPVVNEVQLHDTGVIMQVTPRANKSGRVLLEIAQEVSNVVATSTSGIDSPTIQQRRMSSTVTVQSGETIALGGLIKETQSNTRSGLPVLSRIPVLGALFGSTGRNKTRTELIVLLTPRIIRSSQESDEATLELEKEFKALKGMIPDLRRLAPNGAAGKDVAPDGVR